jgi:hypothetical protein
MAQNSISSELNDLLITHDFDVDALSTRTGRPAVNDRGVPDSSEADMFSFDWVGPTGKNYGTAVILLDQNGGLTMYFGDNLGRTMEPEDKKAWYGDSETDSSGFLEQLKNFAIRTSKIRGGFGLENLSKLKYAIAGQAALTESFYGTRKVSYSGEPTQARLMIKHTRPIAEGDKRYRYVESLFIETAEGERFRLPFRKLAGGRAMLEHVRHGGNPYDMRGQHIAETVNQLNVLSQFRRAHQGRVFEGAAGELVTETDQYYQRLNHNLKHMASSRGYNRYFESWKPADISEGDIMVEDLRGMFVETRIDPRIETALPMLAKIQQEVKAMKEADIFESWAARLVEGTWALPDTPEKMTELKTWFSQPQPLGPDAENVTDVLYPLLGDDALFDQLAAMAEEDPDADAIPIVQAWVTRNKDQSPELSELATSFQTAAPTAPAAPPAVPAAPPVPAAPAAPAPVAEGEDDSVDLEPKIRGLKSEFNKFMKNIERTERDPAYADKADKRYEKMSKRKHPLQQPDHEVDEGENLETFEDIIRLSGAPLKENVLNDSGSTLDYIIKTYQRDIKDFVQNGDMSEPLYDALYDYYQDDMPYGVKKARTGDPFEWVGQRFYNDLQGSDMVDEDRPLSKQMRQMPPGGYSVTNTAMPSAASQIVAPLDLTGQQSMPQQDYIYKDNPIDALATVRQNAGMLSPVATGKSDPFSMLSPSLQAEITRDQQTQDQKDRIERMRQEMPVNECNYTMENEYCPEHGLEECYGQGVYESELARIKSLARNINKDTMDEADYDLGYQDNQLPFVDPRASYVMPANAAEREQDVKDFGHLTKNLNLGNPNSIVNKNVTPSAKTVPFGQNNRTTASYDMPANDAERAADLKDYGPLTSKFNLGSNRAPAMEDKTFDAELARIKSLSSFK